MEKRIYTHTDGTQFQFHYEDVRCHYKGGIYHKISTASCGRYLKANEVISFQIQLPTKGWIDLKATVTDDTMPGEEVAFYQHIHPHARLFYCRPNDMFESILEDGRKRFALI